MSSFDYSYKNDSCVSEDIVGFHGGDLMSLFWQLWNGVWHQEIPQNETARWLTENFSEVFRAGFIIATLSISLFIYCIVVDRQYAKKENKHDAV